MLCARRTRWLFVGFALALVSLPSDMIVWCRRRLAAGLEMIGDGLSSYPTNKSLVIE